MVQMCRVYLLSYMLCGIRQQCSADVLPENEWNYLRSLAKTLVFQQFDSANLWNHKIAPMRNFATVGNPALSAFVWFTYIPVHTWFWPSSLNVDILCSWFVFTSGTQQRRLFVFNQFIVNFRHLPICIGQISVQRRTDGDFVLQCQTSWSRVMLGGPEWSWSNSRLVCKSKSSPVLATSWSLFSAISQPPCCYDLQSHMWAPGRYCVVIHVLILALYKLFVCVFT